MQRKRANCFIYKAKFLVLSFFFFILTLKCRRFRDAFCTCVFVIFIRLQFCIISFISYFIFIRFAQRKFVLFFGGSGISALFYWYLRFRPAILNVCVMLQMLLLVYNCWLFFLLLSLQESSTTHKKWTRVFRVKFVKWIVKWAPRFGGIKKGDVNAVMYTHHTLSTSQWSLRMTVKSGTRHTPQFNTLNVWYKERYQLSEWTR